MKIYLIIPPLFGRMHDMKKKYTYKKVVPPVNENKERKTRSDYYFYYMILYKRIPCYFLFPLLVSLLPFWVAPDIRRR